MAKIFFLCLSLSGFSVCVIGPKTRRCYRSLYMRISIHRGGELESENKRRREHRYVMRFCLPFCFWLLHLSAAAVAIVLIINCIVEHMFERNSFLAICNMKYTMSPQQCGVDVTTSDWNYGQCCRNFKAIKWISFYKWLAIFREKVLAFFQFDVGRKKTSTRCRKKGEKMSHIEGYKIEGTRDCELEIIIVFVFFLFLREKC